MWCFRIFYLFDFSCAVKMHKSPVILINSLEFGCSCLKFQFWQNSFAQTSKVSKDRTSGKIFFLPENIIRRDSITITIAITRLLRAFPDRWLEKSGTFNWRGKNFFQKPGKLLSVSEGLWRSKTFIPRKRIGFSKAGWVKAFEYFGFSCDCKLSLDLENSEVIFSGLSWSQAMQKTIRNKLVVIIFGKNSYTVSVSSGIHETSTITSLLLGFR